MEEKLYTKKQLLDFGHNCIVRNNINLVEQLYHLIPSLVVEQLCDKDRILSSVNQQQSVDFPNKSENNTNTLFDMYTDGGDAFIGLVPRLKEISELTSNWDGYGAEPVHPNVMMSTISKLYRFKKDEYLSEDIFDFYPNPSGTITFDWCIPGSIDGWDVFISIEMGLSYSNYYSCIRKDGWRTSYLYSSKERIVDVDFNQIVDECVDTFKKYLKDNNPLVDSKI